MADANPLWGAPRIHGELSKLGIAISQATVAKYMPRRRRAVLGSYRSTAVCCWANCHRKHVQVLHVHINDAVLS